MKRYLEAVPPELHDGTQDAKENNSSHLKRYTALEQLVALHPTVVRWLLLNRWLEPRGLDPIIVPYHEQAEFALPAGVRSPVQAALHKALGELKGRQTNYSEPVLDTVGTSQYLLRRRVGPKLSLKSTTYDHLKALASTANPGPFHLGALYDLLARYEPLGLDGGTTVESSGGLSYLESYYQLLEERYGVTSHLLSTPLSNYYPSYGSLYYDVDHYFGSLGCLMYNNDPIIDRMLGGGVYELTALLFGEYPHPLLQRIGALLAQVENPIRIIVLLAGEFKWEFPVVPVYHKFIEKANHTVVVYEKNWGEAAKVRKGGKGKQQERAPFDGEALEEYLISVGRSDSTEQVEVEGLLLQYPRPAHLTLPYLTIYEKAMAIGNRAHQFVRGGVAQIEVGEEHDLLRIAERELLEGKMPITIRRTLPNGEYEDHQINSLFDPNASR